MSVDDDEVEALLRAMAPDEAERAALVEAHRQLEKDLLRLSDPPPPPDFVGQVMARVAAAPPRVTRREVGTGVGILMGAVALAVSALASGGGLGGLGVSVARLVVGVHDGLVAVGSGLTALWATAALPVVAALAAVLVVSLAALQRSLQSTTAKVIS